MLSSQDIMVKDEKRLFTIEITEGEANSNWTQRHKGSQRTIATIHHRDHREGSKWQLDTKAQRHKGSQRAIATIHHRDHRGGSNKQLIYCKQKNTANGVLFI